ncbi:MAG: substrate-binding domain-containing protein [Candidatus Solibacter sp.]
MHIVSKSSVALVAVAMSLLSACGGRHEATEKYFLVAANTKIAYWQEAAEGLRAAAREMGVKVEMVGPETYDPKAEKEAFLAAVHAQIPPAGILVSAADPELMRDAIDAAATAGIPVVTIDSDSPKSKRLTFIGTNNYVAGQMSGELLAKELNGKGNVALFSIPGQENLDERVEGFRRVLGRSPGIKIVQVIDIAGDPTKAFDGANNLIAKGKTAPDAFVCMEALSCAEVADVLDRAGIKGKTIIAMDTQEGTLNWMRKGMIRATIAQKPYTMAYFGTRLLDDFHHAKPAPDASAARGTRSPVPVFMDTGATLVDQSNMASFAAPPTPAH